MSYGLWIYFVFGIVGAKNLSPVDTDILYIFWAKDFSPLQR